MDTKQNDDFQSVWERRKQNWQQHAERTLPDDATLLRFAEHARQQAPRPTVVAVPFKQTRKPWIPYAAAASLVIGVVIIGLTRHSQPDNGLPVAEEVTVDSQTVHFICNNGCSAQDIMLLANKVIK